ncbi:MAG: metalloregulator ArsR/SmtB family transcription factor [Acidobacteriota bacterium]
MPAPADPLSQTFSALAHPARRTILARLAQGEANVQELAAPLDMSLPAVSRHIRVLESAGLIRQGQRAQYRPCNLNAEPLREASSWADQIREVWEARFDRMDDYLKVLSPEGFAPEKDEQDA